MLEKIENLTFFICFLQKCYIFSLLEHLRQRIGTGVTLEARSGLGLFLRCYNSFQMIIRSHLKTYQSPKHVRWAPTNIRTHKQRKWPNSLRESLRKSASKNGFLKKCVFSILDLTDTKIDRTNDVLILLRGLWTAFEASQRVSLENLWKNWKSHFFHLLSSKMLHF